ncbi:MAG: DUF6169 family protein [Bacteroidota bacterium]
MQHPYNYSLDGDTFTYRFTTKLGIEYYLVFVEDKSLENVNPNLGDNIYQLILDKKGEQIEPKDAQVFLTIQSIINDFFQQIEHALIYVCADSDSKQDKREKLFSRWYQQSTSKHYLIKIDNQIKIQTTSGFIYMSLLYHIDNAKGDELTRSFRQLAKLLEQDK